MRIKDLGNTANEADLVSGNYFAIDGSAGTKKWPAKIIGQLIKGSGFVTDSVMFEGAGTTYREHYVKCYPDMEYEVVLSSKSWSAPANVTDLSIYSWSDSSQLEKHYEFTVPAGSDAITLPTNVFRFKTNANATRFRIFWRGAVGVSVSVVSSAVFGEHPAIERTINLYGRDMTFVYETSACYPNMDYEVSFSDKNWNIPENLSPYNKLVIQSVDASGNNLKTHFSYSNTYGPIPSVIKFKTHENAVSIKYSFRGSSGVAVNAFQKIAIPEDIPDVPHLDEEIDVAGANLTAVIKFFRCFPSCWYGIEVLNTSWELSSNSSEYTKLSISTFNGGTLISDKFIYMNKSGAIPSTFKFKTEENATQIRIYFRGKSGSSNKFIVRVLPISKIDETPHDVISAKMISNDVKGLLVALNPDTHGDVTTMDVYREYIQDNGCDVVLGLGDHCASHFDPADLSAFFALYAKTEKPVYAIVGNHDVGNSVYVGYAPTRSVLYNALIKPSVDAGYLVNGEYTSNKMYYYHDFSDEKVRLICVDDYDQPFDFEDTYWEAVAYDYSNPDVQLGHAYVAGDIVNCVGVNGYVYDGFSFKAKSSFTTESSYEGTHLPKFKLHTGGVMISAAQAQWLLDTMCSTPADFTIYVVTHQCFSQNCTNDASFKFASKVASTPQDYAWGNYMATDFIANAINAFMNGSNYSEDVAFSGSAEYLNVDGKAYSVSKDFSAKNSGVKFGCCLSGHTHNDLVFRHNTYTSIISVNPICILFSAVYRGSSDVYRTKQFPLASTLVSLGSPDFVKLIRGGVSMTMEMYRRDFEKIYLQ